MKLSTQHPVLPGVWAGGQFMYCRGLITGNMLQKTIIENQEKYLVQSVQMEHWKLKIYENRYCLSFAVTLIYHIAKLSQDFSVKEHSIWHDRIKSHNCSVCFWIPIIRQIGISFIDLAINLSVNEACMFDMIETQYQTML